MLPVDRRNSEPTGATAPLLVDPAEDTAQVGVPSVRGLPVIVGGYREAPLGDIGRLVAG